jgi:pimeloyl-ACP methyl ester carboxylesterase
LHDDIRNLSIPLDSDPNGYHVTLHDMTTTTLRDITVGYDDVGSGTDAVLLVHGHPFNRSMWQPQLDAYAAAGWRTIAPDLRGYGETTVVPGKTTFDVFAADLAALLDQLGLDRVVLGGLSMGGQIVMQFAQQYPSRVRGVVLAATFCEPETEDGKQWRYSMADRLVREGMQPYANEVLPKMLAARSITDFPEVAAHVMTMMCGTNPEGAAAAQRGRAERPDYQPTLAALTVPALVVVGSEDAYTTRVQAERLRDLPRDAELVWLDGVGHMPNLESPEAFNAELIRFLRRLPS